jgi:hypothetical protein
LLYSVTSPEEPAIEISYPEALAVKKKQGTDRSVVGPSTIITAQPQNVVAL